MTPPGNISRELADAAFLAICLVLGLGLCVGLVICIRGDHYVCG